MNCCNKGQTRKAKDWTLEPKAWTLEAEVKATAWAQTPCSAVFDYNFKHIDIVCNISKTVSIVFKPICRHKVICDKFPVLCCLVNVCKLLMNLNIWITF